jgi:predicted DNA-binding transcriptional regulator YafY
MRRAERLFQIILQLRHSRVVTARTLADSLEVSERTIYRDIADLIGSGVPVDGEAGVGYRLRRGYQVPPLMFSNEELAALALGAKLVQGWSDAALGKAAASALARIEAVLPAAHEQRLAATSRRFLAPDFFMTPTLRAAMPALRQALDESRKVRLAYRREDGATSERVIWPLGLVFWGKVWTLGAWCELRQEYRTFRVDRMAGAELSNETFDDQRGRLWQAYLDKMREEAAKYPAEVSAARNHGA